MRSRAAHRVVPAILLAAVLLGALAPARPASAQATDSAALVELRAQVDAIACPAIAGLVNEPQPQTVNAVEEAGINQPAASVTIVCRYRVAAEPPPPAFDVRLVFRWIGATGSSVCSTDPVREEQNGRLSVRGIRPVEATNAVLDYQFPIEVLAAVPGVDASIDAAFVGVAQQVAPLATTCQLDPLPVTCPAIAGATAREPEVGAPDQLLEADCWYDPDEFGTVQLQVVWATERSDDGALRRACSDPGEPFRERTAIVGHPTNAVQTRWLSTAPGIEADAMTAAATDLMNQVLPQARTCDGVAIEPIFGPIPPYLQDVYRPERTGGEAFVDRDRLQAGRDAERAAASAPPATESPAALPPATATAEPADTTPATTTTASSVPVATAEPADPEDRAAAPTPTGDRPGWQTVGLRVVSIVALVLSLLGVALALVLMRRESRIRPRLDVARVVIVLAVAVVSMLVFARGAPVWAIALALVLGGGLGLLQGRNVQVRVRGQRLYATRVAWGVIAFAAALVVTQVAGWLNRTGAISLGIALSFLSAAVTTGVIVGRRPQLRSARIAPGAAVGMLVVAVAALALGPSAPGFTQEPVDEPAPDAPAPDEPADPDQPIECGGLQPSTIRCPQHEALIDLVDWTNVSFNGGLLANGDKPPVVVAVPRGLAEPPEPISRTVEWNGGENLDAPNVVTETFTFELDAEGFCCSVFYEGTAQQRSSPDGPVTEWVASGRLSDIKTVGEDVTGEFESISNVVQGVPFGEANTITWGTGGQEVCGRYVAETVPPSSQNAAFDILTRNGEVIPPDDSLTRIVGLARMTIPCEVPGYTFDAALAAAPPPPTGPDRYIPCPTRQELVTALAAGGLPVTANTAIGDLFISPNEPLCSDGSLSSPMVFGDGARGGHRSEFAFEFAPPEEQSAWGDDSALYEVTGTAGVAPNERCPLDESGRPVPDPARPRCSYNTTHRLGDDGWFTVSSDQQYDDGPNVTIRASLPWGAYRYRCHHCELNDPEIERFLGALHDFARGWPDALEAEGFGVTSDGDIVTTTVVPTPETDALAEEAEQLGVDADLAELFIDDELLEEAGGDDAAGAAALAALVGLMGSLGLAGTALAESGMSASELAETFRRGGLDALDAELDARARADAESVVLDEHGDELRPGDDGLYEWDDGDSVRRVARDELEELIARARSAQAAQAADEVTRLAEHERFRDESWDELRDRVRITTAVEMAEIELAQAERDARFRRGTRLRDALEQMEDSAIRDRMLDLLERDPAPSDDDFWRLREIMRQQEADQRAIDALGDRSEIAMALEGIQEDTARLAEAAGQPGLATIIRNPEVPARLATAYATGGFSEVALAPIDLWLALDDKADAVMAAEHRDLTTGEIVAEVAWAVGVEYLGSRVFGGGVEPPPGPKRPMQLLPENYIEQVRPGQRIPLLHQTGYTPEHITRLTNFAERHGVVPGARTANQYSAAHIRAGTALPKPLDIKPKTINEIDLHLGARADHLGTVGFFEPKMPDTSSMSADLRRQVEERFAARLKEQGKYLDEIRANPRLRIEGGRVIDAKTGKAFAGDMDLVYLRDAKTGEVITGQRYIDLRNEMIDEGLIEHGAEFNIHADLTEGLTPGTDEYEAALKQADKIAQEVLMPNHDDGALIMEVRNGHAVRGEPITMLPINP